MENMRLWRTFNNTALNKGVGALCIQLKWHIPTVCVGEYNQSSKYVREYRAWAWTAVLSVKFIMWDYVVYRDLWL